MKNKKTGKKKVSGYIKEINGIWHIVIVYYDAQGKRKFSSVSTKLKVKGNKRNATRLMEYILDLFEIPNEGDKLNLKKYLNSDLEKNKAKLDKIKTKKKGKQNKDETKKYIPISSDMLFADFLYFWLKAVKSSIALNTYGTYYMTVNSKIAPYFREKNIKLNELSTIDLQNYYSYEEEVERLSPNTILKRHNNINQALKYAINLELIEKNPADRVIKPGYITQHFNQYLKKHGARHIRFHDLRHTCATLMLAKGENLVKVQKWLGHSDISTTANNYAHLDFQSKADSANNLLNIMPDSLI